MMADADSTLSAIIFKSHPRCINAAAWFSFGATMPTAYKISLIPAAKNCSASLSVETVIPLAPAASCA